MSAGVLVIMLAVGLIGCQPPVDSAGQAMLARAHRSYEYSQYEQAIETLTTFLETYPRATEAAEAHYLRGLSYRQLDPPDDEAALKDLREATRLAPENSPLWSLAQAAIGHTLFEKNTTQDQLQAITHYQRALRHLPNEPPRDAVLYRLAAAQQNMGRWRQADQHLSECIDTFGDSAFAQAARLRFGARRFRIQFAAYSDLDRARAHIDRLAQQALTADWTAVQRGEAVLYTVRMGNFNTYEQAAQALPRARAVQPDATIVAAEPVTPTRQ